MFVVLLAMLGYVLIGVPAHYHESQGGDFPYYVEMAEHPLGSTVPAPWRYRPVHPMLASVLIGAGLPVNAAFLALTFVFAVVSCALMAIYLRQLGLSTFAARAGALLFAVTAGGFVPLRRYFGYSDTITNTFILLVLMAVVSRRTARTAAALGVGTLVKETLLLYLPFALWRSWKQSAGGTTARSTRLGQLAAIAVPPLAAFVLLRVVIGPDPAGTSSVALSWSTQVAYWREAMIHGPARWVLWALAYSMGPVWLLAAIGARHNLRFLGGSALLLVPLLAPLARTTDTERALMLAFPVVFPLAAHALERVRHSRHAVAAAASAIVCAWVAQLTFGWSSTARWFGVSPKDVVFLALCLAPAAAVLLVRHQGAEPPLVWSGLPAADASSIDGKTSGVEGSTATAGHKH